MASVDATHMAHRSNNRPSPWWLLAPTPFIATASSLFISHPDEVYRQAICWSYGLGAEECDRWPAEPLTVVILTWYLAIFSEILLPWITAPWLGFLSDRYGRTRVLTLLAIASLVGNMSAISAYWIASIAGNRVPDICLLILGGAVIQGAIGGLTIISAVTRAYLVDTTTEANRASILSVHFGLNSVGTLIATILPSLVRQLHWPPIRVHYILTGIHAAYALYVCHVVPDSLSNEEKHQAQESYRNSQDPEFGFWKSVKKVASLCNPFATFGPTTINTSGNPLRHDLGKNWSLAFLYLGLLLGSIGTEKFKDKVTSSIYQRWGGTISKYSYCGFEVVAFLAFPALKMAIMPKTTVASALTEESKGLYSILQDLKIGHISITITLACYTVLSLFPNSSSLPLPNAALPTLAGVLGIVFQPALMSVITSTYKRQGSRHIGRLLGCLVHIEYFSFFYAGYCINVARNIAYPAFLVALYCLIRHVGVPEIHVGTQIHMEEGEEEERLVNEE